MAAGLPILTNNMVNTIYHITKANCGLSCCFQNEEILLKLLKSLVS